MKSCVAIYALAFAAGSLAQIQGGCNHVTNVCYERREGLDAKSAICTDVVCLANEPDCIIDDPGELDRPETGSARCA